MTKFDFYFVKKLTMERRSEDRDEARGAEIRITEGECESTLR